MSTSGFKKLFESLKIGELTLRNRIVMAPMATNFGSDDGYVTDRMISYYGERAKGGAGLITVEGLCVDYPRGKFCRGMLAGDNDKYFFKLEKLVQTIHVANAKASVQIHHAGPRADFPITGIQPVGPSPVATMGTIPRELTIGEIEEIIMRYARTAARAKRADFDAIEIQFGGGYLLGSFLSAVTNKRQDSYGGELKNRARIHLNILKAVRNEIGPDFPVFCRLNVKEYGSQYAVENCLTIEEGQEFASMVVKAGVNAISVLAYGFLKTKTGELSQDHFVLFLDDRGAYIPLAEAIKKAVNVPITTAGRFTPELAERTLQQGKTDLVAFGRQLIADPHFPNKLAEGKGEDITPCIVCRICIERDFEDNPIECSVNAAAGREKESEIVPASRKKRVLIAGGGPSGMEAGRVAAQRGHEVILYEKDRLLGGMLTVAALVKGTEVEDFWTLVKYLITQLKKAGVRVELGKQVNQKISEKLKPDVIVLGIGGISVLPEISGITNSKVADASRIRTMAKFLLRFLDPNSLRWLTKFWIPLGKRVVLIGGGMMSLELAEFLCKRGRKLIILEESDKLGTGMVSITRIRLVRWLRGQGATMLTGVKYDSITNEGVVIITKDGRRQVIEADAIVPVTPLKPNNELLKALQGNVPEVYLIGDGKEPDHIRQAIADGAHIGRVI